VEIKLASSLFVFGYASVRQMAIVKGQFAVSDRVNLSNKNKLSQQLQSLVAKERASASS